MIDYDITSGIEAVTAAASKLTKEKHGGCNARRLELLEQECCMETRTLFSRFIDVVLWSGELDPVTSRAVRGALHKGLSAINTSPDVKKSVRRRIEEFEVFVAEHRKSDGPVPA